MPQSASSAVARLSAQIADRCVARTMSERRNSATLAIRRTTRLRRLTRQNVGAYAAPVWLISDCGVDFRQPASNMTRLWDVLDGRHTVNHQLHRS